MHPTAARDVPSDLVGTGLHPTLPDAPQLAWRRWSTKRRRIHASRKLAWKGLQWMISRSVMVTGEAFIVLRRLPDVSAGAERDSDPRGNFRRGWAV